MKIKNIVVSAFLVFSFAGCGTALVYEDSYYSSYQDCSCAAVIRTYPEVLYYYDEYYLSDGTYRLDYENYYGVPIFFDSYRGGCCEVSKLY